MLGNQLIAPTCRSPASTESCTGISSRLGLAGGSTYASRGCYESAHARSLITS